MTSGVPQLCLESRRSSVRAAPLCFRAQEHGGRDTAPSDCLESLLVLSGSGSGSPQPCRMVSTSLQNESRQSLSGCCCWSWEDASLVLWVSSAAAWSRVPAHGSTLISVGLGFLVQTYTHGKKSQACMQTTEQTRNGTYEHGRWRINQSAGRDKRMEGGLKRDGRWRERAQRGGLYCSGKIWHACAVPCIATRCQYRTSRLVQGHAA